GADTIDFSGANYDVVLDGGSGQDTLKGGHGNNTFVLHQGNDSAQGGTGTAATNEFYLVPNSTLSVTTGGTFNALNFSMADFGITFNLSQNTGTAQDVFPSDPGLHYVALTGSVQKVIGSGFNDRLFAAPVTIPTGYNLDTLFGAVASISGGDGNDTLFGSV